MRLLRHVGVRLFPRRPNTVDGGSWSHFAASQRRTKPHRYLNVRHLCGSADVARPPLGGRACTTPAAHREGSSRIFRRVQDKEVEVADVIIIGAGAAGLTAAYFAAERHPGKVILLERTNEGGKKILMSGGSRCNVLPGSVDTTAGTDFFTESSGRALQAVLRSWSLDKCQDWLQTGVGLTLAFEPDDNKWFPSSNSAKQVRDKLVAACLDRGVSIRYSAFVSSLEQHAVEDAGAAMGGSSRQDQPLWCCWLGGETRAGIAAHQVVVATGGLSFPAVGTDGTGHRILARLGHRMHATYPALTPLTGSHPGGASLAGVSVYSVDLKCTSGPGVSRKGRSAERHGFLFTHKGYSGPSVLDLSHHAVMSLERADDTASASASPAVLEANWAGKSEEDWRSTIAQASGKAYVVNILARNLPQRLADALAAEAGLPPQRRIAELRKEERQRLLQLLTRYRLPYSGHQGYRKAEVTGGGVPLSEVKCSTMESKVLPGIFLCGEIVDVFGRIGGFNFYWAWVSGRLAGLSAATAASRACS